MTKPRESDPKTYAHERKYRRFDLRYPVQVKFLSGSRISELDAVSRNVSLGGMLLEMASLIPQNSRVSFRMTVHGGRVLRPIELAGEGEVVRVEHTGGEFAIAVRCKRPITRIEPYLPAVAC
jgi:PilZ domain